MARVYPWVENMLVSLIRVRHSGGLKSPIIYFYFYGLQKNKSCKTVFVCSSRLFVLALRAVRNHTFFFVLQKNKSFWNLLSVKKRVLCIYFNFEIESKLIRTHAKRDDESARRPARQHSKQFERDMSR